jgi:hypothetical protein
MEGHVFVCLLQSFIQRKLPSTGLWLPFASPGPDRRSEAGSRVGCEKKGGRVVLSGATALC